jgi:hypothetical protein
MSHDEKMCLTSIFSLISYLTLKDKDKSNQYELKFSLKERKRQNIWLLSSFSKVFIIDVEQTIFHPH